MKENYSHLVFVFDRSGSTANIFDDILNGLNYTIEENKKLGLPCTVSIVHFDDEIVVRDRFVPIEKVKPLTRDDVSPRGSTRLWDAMGETIIEEGKVLAALPEHQRPEIVVFQTMTDGEENASRYWTVKEDKPVTKPPVSIPRGITAGTHPFYKQSNFQTVQEDTRKDLKALIQQQQDIYNWKFQFIGANQDAVLTASSMGISRSMAINYSANAAGTLNVYCASAANIKTYRLTKSVDALNYSDADRIKSMAEDE